MPQELRPTDYWHNIDLEAFSHCQKLCICVYIWILKFHYKPLKLQSDSKQIVLNHDRCIIIRNIYNIHEEEYSYITNYWSFWIVIRISLDIIWHLENENEFKAHKTFVNSKYLIIPEWDGPRKRPPKKTKPIFLWSHFISVCVHTFVGVRPSTYRSTYVGSSYKKLS